MANFAQRKIARESIEGTGTVVPDGLELPAESVEGILAELAENEKNIDQHDSEGDVLTEDVSETEAQLDAVDEADAAAGDEAGEDSMDAEEDMPDEAAEALDVAQESIRRRWGFDHRVSVAQEAYGSRKRRQVARESLWDDIKAFFRRIWEWLKEQGRKVKDRWLKFSNQGKSIQKRSKQYAEAIKNLGKLKTGKEELKGGFIKSLSIGGKFIGDNVTELKKEFDSAEEFQKGQTKLLEDATSMVGSMEKNIAEARNSGKEGFGTAASLEYTAMERDMRDLATESEALGGMTTKIVVEGTGDEITVTASAVESEVSVPSEVKTPSTATLGAVNTFYGNLGKEIEKLALAYHATNQKREKYEKGIENVLKRIDALKVDDVDKDIGKVVRIGRRMISNTQSMLATCERVTSGIVKNAVSGLNSYISAGIACYEKK